MATKQRGRRSSAQLMSPKPLELYPRQPVPPELSGEAAEVFRAIVDTEEAAWFNKSNIQLLVQYCRHTITAKRVAELIEAAGDSDLDLYGRLLVMQRAESAALASLSVKLRLAPSSARKNRGQPRPDGPKPWQRGGYPHIVE
jgi:hypothetical protein